MISFCNNIIKYSIYLLFFLVPLIFAGNTSELFELNKMWITFGLTIIVGVAWITKMILEKRVSIQRTPLDIPILLFLLSQIISTIFSLDQQVSLWGYYSRFNGGLFSTVCYVLLFYAIASHFSVKNIFTLLKVTLAGCLATALWGFPSHFGYDPTCLVFRGTLDTNCWTYQFQPTVRVFSTLGQPAWFAAYLAALIPIVIAYTLNCYKNTTKYWLYLIFAALLYLDLIFAHTRAGSIGFVLVYVIFWIFVFVQKIFTFKIFLRNFIIINIFLLLSNFFFGFPVDNLNTFTFSGLTNHFSQHQSAPPAPAALQPSTTPSSKAPQPTLETGITDSGIIREFVWKGAIDAWKSSPLFGTGVETYAFAYYKFRPAGHNMTSEWDYLYNKAHNEYLNYLATTGLFGLGTYLAFIFIFIFLVLKPITKSLFKGSTFVLARYNSEVMKDPKSIKTELLTIGIFTGWLSILITNFFGFSVVIMNLFLFLMPLFIFILNDMLPEKTFSFGAETSESPQTNPYQWTVIALITIIAGWMIVGLARYWDADTKYALGMNLDGVGSYQQAYPLLLQAAMIEPNEPVYKDELAINTSVLATALAVQKDQTSANQFMNNAIKLSDDVVTSHPNNVVYWKNRVRIFYTLAQAADPQQQLAYFQEALKAIQTAHDLAPTDAKISYNLGVLYGQTGNIQQGIGILQDTIKLKPDYRDPYFALGLFYHQLALNQNNYVVNPAMQQKAVDTYKYILTNLNPNDQEVKKSLKDWGVK